MPQTKKLQNEIENKLEKLSKLLDKFDEARIIDSEDSETWDSDTLYNLLENLKETLTLLENKTHPHNKDPFGEPLVLEEGLCSLMDNYWEEDEETDF